jgi:hypothetical protein
VNILIRTLIAIFLITSVPILGSAQKESSKSQAVPEKKSSDVSKTCDGALDIVPVKSMTFVRKRRPNKNDIKNPAISPKKLEHK